MDKSFFPIFIVFGLYTVFARSNIDFRVYCSYAVVCLNTVVLDGDIICTVCKYHNVLADNSVRIIGSNGQCAGAVKGNVAF